MIVVEARDVTKTFATANETVHVLRGLSLTVRRGEVVSIEGPSGSGKTTFLSILGCLLMPTSGSVAIEGVPMNPQHLSSARRRSIGFVFQQYNLFRALTALENVEFALNLKGYRDSESRKEAEMALDAVGLSDRASFLPRELSGGQKQRLAIARAVSGRSAVLLADEPTANLDSDNGSQVLDLFRALAKRNGKALIVVTHDPKVREISDCVVRILDGRFVSEG